MLENKVFVAIINGVVFECKTTLSDVLFALSLLLSSLEKKDEIL